MNENIFFMCKDYLEVFDRLINSRDQIAKNCKFSNISFLTLTYKLNLKF